MSPLGSLSFASISVLPCDFVLGAVIKCLFTLVGQKGKTEEIPHPSLVWQIGVFTGPWTRQR